MTHLRSCARLSCLTLEGNPLSKHGAYRRVVHHHLPALASLDEEPYTDQDRAPVCVRASVCVRVCAGVCVCVVARVDLCEPVWFVLEGGP